MKQSRPLSSLLAVALAVTFSVTSLTLLAADPKLPNQTGHPYYNMGPGMWEGVMA